MRQVIKINEEPKDESQLKPIEFTHVLSKTEGWCMCAGFNGMGFTEDKIVYLGKCKIDGDMFAKYCELLGGIIHIYKGHLNDGVY